MSDTRFRVTYRVSRDGKPFRVDKQSIARPGQWLKVATFGHLERALLEYPSAEPDAIAEQMQRQLENVPHKFDNREGRNQCFVCGHGDTWSAHNTRHTGGEK